MNTRSLALLSLLILPLIPPSPTSAQKKSADDSVRDTFLYTRVKIPAEKPGKPMRAVPTTGRRQTGKANHPIGLGYTVYQRDADDNPVRVSESREFRRGDAVRLVIESNTDGYLYIFNTENDGPPRMIFPDARLNGGRNNIAAHVPYETPSSREPNPRLRWFVFSQKTGIERLYLVIAKRPLPDVPVGNQLVARCRTDLRACPWRPAESVWTQLAVNVDSSREEKSGEFGQTLTAVERDAVERSVELGLDAPAPSVIRISKSPRATQLVTMLAFVHK